MTHSLLNLGCGARYHPQWVNVDFTATGAGVIAHDLHKPLPFREASFDVVYHSHVLEHFQKKNAVEFLEECRRVLRPNGILRVVVPDLEQIAREYLLQLERSIKGDKMSSQKYEWIALEMLDQMVRTYSGGAMGEYWKRNPLPTEEYIVSRVGSEVKVYLKAVRSRPSDRHSKHPDEKSIFGHLREIISSRRTMKDFLLRLLLRDNYRAYAIGRFRLAGEVHQWMYDRFSLNNLLRDSGFVNIRPCKADESTIPGFNAFFLDLEQDGSVRKPDSLFMEAMKP